MVSTSLLRIALTRSLKPFVFCNRNHKHLDYENLEDLGLYVHIPFCRSICTFCPYAKEVYNKEHADAYKKALLKEIDLVCREQKEKKAVTSLYFGGGTPTLMVEDLADIIAKLREYFFIEGGVGVELHPSDITIETMAKLKAAGVTMVSIGIQSFHQECLDKLGRRGEAFTEKINYVKSIGMDVVDVDLIFAIPGQTEEILKEDIRTAFESGATQISTYPFIDFTFADNAYKPLSNRVKKRMLRSLADFCRELNVERTSVWTFAKKGTDKYSSVTRDTFLGFGASATSLLRKSFKINTFSVEEYCNRIDKDRLPTSLTLSFSRRQRAVYFLFWSAYSMRIYKDKFETIIGVPIQKMYGKELRLACKFGYLWDQGEFYELTDKAILLYHSIEQVYTTAYIDKMWNVSRVEPFPEKIVLR